MEPASTEAIPKVQKYKARALAYQSRMKTLELAEAPPGERFLARVYRFVVLLIQEITRIELPRRAAALTYTTILSIFPVLALVTSTASLFYTEEKQQEAMGWIQNQFLPAMEIEESLTYPPTQEQAEAIEKQRVQRDRVEQLFNKASSAFRDSAASVGVFGFIGLLITCGILYMSIEQVVNFTWRSLGVGTWGQTLTNFITILVIVPILLGVSVAGTGFAVALLSKNTPPEVVAALDPNAEPAADNQDGQTGGEPPAPAEAANGAAEPRQPATGQPEGPPAQAQASAPTGGEVPAGQREMPSMSQAPRFKGGNEALMSSGFFYHVRKITSNFGFIIPYIPVVVNALVLALAFTFIPRVRVRWYYALMGGFIGSALWEIARYMFFSYMYSSMVNRTLTDILGITVIFLIWIYISWIILLFANLITYMAQNFDLLWAEKLTGEQIMLDGRLLVAMLVLLADKFDRRGGGFTEMELRQRLGLDAGQFDQIMDRLIAAGLVSKLEKRCYQIAKPPDHIPLSEVLAMGCDLRTLPIGRAKRSGAARVLEAMQRATLEVPHGRTLQDLLRMEPRQSKQE